MTPAVHPPSSAIPLLVTDGEERAALAVVRSLGRGGIPVLVGSRSGRSLAGASKWCEEELRLPSPLDAPDRYAEEVSRLASEGRISGVIPITEAALLALGEIESFPVPVAAPPPDALALALDKDAVLRAAGEVGIAVPRQLRLDRPEDLPSLLPELEFPVVLKPSRSVTLGKGKRTRVGVLYATDATELLERAASLPRAAYPLLLQERIVGPGIGIFVLILGGEPVATFSHRRLREKPPSGGVSTYREALEPDPDLLERSLALLAALRWEGVAMVEYKVRSADGTPFLMEINPRFWGSLQLAVDAGVDFPLLVARTLRGEPLPPPKSIRRGLRLRWEWGDMDHLVARMRGNDSTLPPDAPSLPATLFALLPRPGNRREVLRLTDPRPFLRESRLWFRALRPSSGGSDR